MSAGKLFLLQFGVLYGDAGIPYFPTAITVEEVEAYRNPEIQAEVVTPFGIGWSVINIQRVTVTGIEFYIGIISGINFFQVERGECFILFRF